MNELHALAMRLAAFSAAAGCVEMLLPEGKGKKAVLSLLGLLALRLTVDSALGFFGADMR